MRNPPRIRRLIGTVVVTATLVAVFVLIPAWTATGNTALLHSATFGDTPCSPLHVPEALPDGSVVRHSEEWSMEDLAEFWKSLMGWVTEEFEEWNDEWYEEWDEEWEDEWDEEWSEPWMDFDDIGDLLSELFGIVSTKEIQYAQRDGGVWRGNSWLVESVLFTSREIAEALFEYILLEGHIWDDYTERIIAHRTPDSVKQSSSDYPSEFRQVTDTSLSHIAATESGDLLFLIGCNLVGLECLRGPYDEGETVAMLIEIAKLIHSLNGGPVYSANAEFVPDGWPEACQVSSGRYEPGDKVRADCRVKNTGSAQARLEVVFKARGPDGRMFSTVSDPETILPGRRHTFMADQDDLLLAIPADAPGGSYGVRLEVRSYETGEVYDVWPSSGWRNDQFEVIGEPVPCADTVVKGELITNPVFRPFRYFELRIDEVVKDEANEVSVDQRIIVAFSELVDSIMRTLYRGDCVQVAGIWDEEASAYFPGIVCDPDSCSDHSLLEIPCASCDRLDWPVRKDGMGTYVINLAYGDYDARLHDGIDILCEPETPVYAVESGTAKRLGDKFDERLLVEGRCYSIEYTHINAHSSISDGDFVTKGQTIGHVLDFEDFDEENLLNHLHFSLRKRDDSGMTAENPLLVLDPSVVDRRAPTIEETLFRENEHEDWWDHNGLREFMPREAFMDRDNLYGEVDIVVKAYDYIGGQGEMEKTGVYKIQYEIIDSKGVTIDEKVLVEWDGGFGVGAGGCKNDTDRKVGYLYEQPKNCLLELWDDEDHGKYPWTRLRGEHQMWYSVTNTNKGDGTIDEVDYHACWDTEEKNEDGSPKYPNGKYTVKTTVWDAAGNDSFCPQTVTVNNSWLENLIEQVLKISTFSPVDISVIDPEGLVISKSTNTIPEATYEEVDLNGDGDLDDRITIMNRKEGDYGVRVIPEARATDDDVYTLEVSVGGETSILADNVQIRDIPSTPYVVRSSLGNVKRGLGVGAIIGIIVGTLGLIAAGFLVFRFLRSRYYI